MTERGHDRRGAAGSEPPLLTVDGLTVAFPGEDGGVAREVVSDVSLRVGAGEVLAIVGESGSGKSLTARAITRLLPPQGRILRGSVTLDGRDLTALSEARMRSVRGEEIAMVFQDPMNSLDPTMPVGDQVGETLRLHRGVSRREAARAAVALLDRVGIPDPDRRARHYPHQFSGGQRQRICIAIALACEPRLLIADEPTTALDVTVQAQILDLLLSLRETTGMSLILITHDLGVVARTADRVAVMHEGRIVETGSTDDVLRAPRDPYTRRLVAAMTTERVREEVRVDEPLVRIRDLSVSHRVQGGAEFRAVDDVSLDIGRGEIVGLVGESGSGKSSLGRAVVGLYTPSGGTIEVAGVRLGELRRRTDAQRRAVQMIFQDPYGSLNPRLTVRESIREGLIVNRLGRSAADRDERIDAALADVGLDPADADRYPHEFSGGQRQRIGIARVLVVEPTVLVCDEPTSALDATIRVQVVDLLVRLQRERGLSLLYISHDLATVHRISDRIAVMRGGRLVEVGDADQVYLSPREPYTRELVAAELH